MVTFNQQTLLQRFKLNFLQKKTWDERGGCRQSTLLVWTPHVNLTCDDQPARRGGELRLPGESVLGPALVRLEAVLGRHVPDLELPAGQHHVLPVWKIKTSVIARTAAILRECVAGGTAKRVKHQKTIFVLIYNLIFGGIIEILHRVPCRITFSVENQRCSLSQKCLPHIIKIKYIFRVWAYERDKCRRFLWLYFIYMYSTMKAICL